MKNKTILALAGTLLVFMSLPLMFLSRFLLYKHVEATPVLWLLFWIDLPLTVTMNLVGSALKSIK